MGTSSAKPANLYAYRDGGLTQVGQWEVELVELRTALDELRTALADADLPEGFSVAVPRYEDTFARLVRDQRHLDEWVGDVADGFLRASGIDPTASGLVVPPGWSATADDREIQVGYADRQEAVDAAHALAREIEDLVDGEGGATRADIARLVDMGERGRHDPAFAVTLSERIGVSGYVLVAAAIREVYTSSDDADGDGRDGGRREAGAVPPDGIAAVQVLGGILTTALDTRAGIPRHQRHDPDNHDLDRSQRLDDGFVDDLVEGFPTDPAYSGAQEDLSVLLRFTDPPTSVAVEIAGSRLTPLLAEGYRHQPETHPTRAGVTWGEHGDPVTNYATMLSRNPDASALWLRRDAPPGVFGDAPDGNRNVDLVLTRDGSWDADGGRALARVVRHGLTSDHPDVTTRTWDDGTDRFTVTHDLMVEGVEAIGADDVERIVNPHMHAALAAGVEHNMPTLDHLVSSGWNVNEGGEPGRATQDTHRFLRELMRDDDAADRVVAATQDYMVDQIRAAPPPGVDSDADHFSDDRRDVLNRIGAVHGLVTQAEANALEGSVEEYIARQEARAARTDFVVGLLPLAGDAHQGVGKALEATNVLNSIAQTQGQSIGALFHPIDPNKLDEVDETINLAKREADVDNLIFLAIADHADQAPPEIRSLIDGSARSLSDEDRRAVVEWAFTTANGYEWDALAHGADIMERFNDREDRRP